MFFSGINYNRSTNTTKAEFLKNEIWLKIKTRFMMHYFKDTR